MKNNTSIREQLQNMKCPVCSSGLYYSGTDSLFRFVEFDDLDSGWQDGKSDCDGYTFACAKDERHNIAPVIPENMMEILDFLNNL